MSKTFYFLIGKDTNQDSIYYVGPFCPAVQTDELFIGQIVSSNSFKMKYNPGMYLSFKLCHIKTNSSNLNDIKYLLMPDENNHVYMCDINGILNENNTLSNNSLTLSNNSLTLNENNTRTLSNNDNYILTFSLNEGYIMCPSLQIKYN